MDAAPLAALVAARVPAQRHPPLRVEPQRRQNLGVVSIREVGDDFNSVPLGMEKLSVVDSKLQGLTKKL